MPITPYRGHFAFLGTIAESIKYIDDRVQKERFHNVKTILSTPDDPKLPPNSVDSVLILKTYHEIAAPVVLLENLRRSLRSSARLGIIDRNGNGQDHGVQKDVVIKEAAQAGYRLVEQYDFVKPDREDYFLVFQLNSDQAQERSLTIVTDYAFDGRGKVLRNLEIEIRGDKIVSIRKSGGNSSRPNYDLRGFTVLPGWIDSHTHPTWHFGPNGHFGEKDELPERATLEAEGNAWWWRGCCASRASPPACVRCSARSRSAAAASARLRWRRYGSRPRPASRCRSTLASACGGAPRPRW